MNAMHAAQIRFLEALAALKEVAINAGDVYEDLQALAEAFPEPDAYTGALREVLGQLRILVRRTPGQPMKGRFTGWRRHAFQSQRRRGARADLRVVYRVTGDQAEVLGFGHRRSPLDVYARLAARRDRPPAP